jgi:hypothetical protein
MQEQDGRPAAGFAVGNLLAVDHNLFYSFHPCFIWRGKRSIGPDGETTQWPNPLT